MRRLMSVPLEHLLRFVRELRGLGLLKTRGGRVGPLQEPSGRRKSGRSEFRFHVVTRRRSGAGPEGESDGFSASAAWRRSRRAARCGDVTDFCSATAPPVSELAADTGGVFDVGDLVVQVAVGCLGAMLASSDR